MVKDHLHFSIELTCFLQDFRKGMHTYLTKHKYNNTFTEDLWAALSETSQKPVEKIMSTWTQQMGYPVLTVSIFISNISI